METKCCKKCNEVKLLTNEFFGKKSKSPDGFHQWCKICVSEYNRTDSAKNAIKKYKKTEKGVLLRKKISYKYARSEKRKIVAKRSHSKLGSGVYEIINLITGDNYIGYAQLLQQRKEQHFSYYKKHISATCKSLQDDMKLYSKDAFYFHILEQLPKNKQLLEQREEYWISKLNPIYNTKLS